MPTGPRSTSSACSRAGSRPPRRSSSLTYRDDEAGPRPTRSAEFWASCHGRPSRACGSSRCRRGRWSDLAQPYEVDAVELHRVTGGNPFYVTEALAAGGAALPESVRDAVLARAARLPAGARALLDAVAIAPPRAELWLLEQIAAEELAHVEEGLTSGMLRVHRDGIAFRHEIERVAIDETMPPDRRHELHQRALGALAGPPRRADLARVAHHAEAAGDIPAVLEFAPAAARARRRLRRPSRVGRPVRAGASVRRWAARHGARAPARAARVRVLSDPRDRRGDRCPPSGPRRAPRPSRPPAGGRHAPVALAAGVVRRRRDRGGGRSAPGDRDPRAAAVEPRARDGLQQHGTASDARGRRRPARATGAGGRSTSPSASATPTCSSTPSTTSDRPSSRAARSAGAEKLERSLRLAADAGLDEHVARAHTNLAVGAIETREYALADRHLAAGIDYYARARPRLVARVHDRLEGTLRPRARAVEEAAAGATAVLSSGPASRPRA